MPALPFTRVRRMGLTLPGVEAGVRYDGSPVLRLGGCFLAGLASHPSVEPGTLVVRASFDERQGYLDDAPDTYYLTDYYRPHPVVLARLARLDPEALRGLIAASWRHTSRKAGRRSPGGSTDTRRGGARAVRRVERFDRSLDND